MGETETRARQCLLGDTRLNSEGQPVYCPYNCNNKKITVQCVEKYFSSHGVDHAVYDMRTFQCAVVHRTYIQRNELDVREAGAILAPCPPNAIPLAPQSNERLEFLGDGIIEMVVKHYLYLRYPQENEGFLTEKKINIVKNETLGRICKDEGLARWFQLSQHAEDTGVRNNDKKLGGLLEALVGALFVDVSERAKDEGVGYQACRKFVISLIEKNIDWQRLMTENDNHKNTLQILIQKEFKTTPTYVEIQGKDIADSGYTMAVMLVLGENPPKQSVPFSRVKTFAKIHELSGVLGGCRIVLGVGKHAFKKKAEQLACFNALKAVKVS